MQKKYKHLFFDLDRTLWDFEKSMHETLTFLHNEYLTNIISGTPIQFIETFDRVHEQLWEKYRRGQIKKDVLRTARFNLTLQEFGIKNKELAKTLNNKYLEICPLKNNLFPHTLEALDYLSKSYHLYILTNGFINTQNRKISNCGLDKYFTKVFSSEKIGYNKPDPRIFAWAVNSVNAKKETCLMIGDDPKTDIGGAKEYGIDQILFNPQKNTYSVIATYEIESLIELTKIL